MVNKKFLLAEILACVTFILNTINVITTEASAWLPQTGVIYWSKTIMAIVGLYFFFTSAVFVQKIVSRYISISTLILLLFSLPVVNTYFILLISFLMILLKLKLSLTLEYKEAVIIQGIWLIPLCIILIHIFSDIAKVGIKNNEN